MAGRTRPEAVDPPRLRETAVRYGEHGWPVIPLHTPGPHGCSCQAEVCGSPGKHPRTSHGLHDATVDAARIRQWWTRWPDANIGIVTGTVSGLLVLDVDLPDGPAALHLLETDHGRLPDTCSQRTGSGGRQLLFAHPDRQLRNRAGLVEGVDVRADGGYIVVPPSVHVVGGRYRWLVKAPPADPPGWLVDLLTRRRMADPPRIGPPGHHPARAPGDTSRYAAVALERELSQLATAVEGTRNHTLNRAAFNLGQLVGAGLLDRDVVASRLEQVAIHVGLGEVETRRTIASGLAAGTAQPRPIPPASSRAVPTPVTSPAAPRRVRVRGR